MKSLNKIKKKMKKWVKDKDENVSFARVISLVHIMILVAIVLFVLLLFWIDSAFGIENIARMLQELLSFFQRILIGRFELLRAEV